MTTSPTGEYVAYFCHAKEDQDWVFNSVIHKLESKHHGLKCAQYDRDFPRGGAFITDLWQEFFEKSQFIVVILSPEFLKITEAMYQLHLAVHYCYDADVGKIIPIIHRKCLSPLFVKCFKEIDTAHKSWFHSFVDRLKRPGLRYPREPICCEAEDHVDLSLIKPLVERKALSNPVGLQPWLPEHIFGSLKIHALKQTGHMPFEKLLRESCTDKCLFANKHLPLITDNNCKGDVSKDKWIHDDVIKGNCDRVYQDQNQDSTDFEKLAVSLEKSLDPYTETSDNRVSHKSEQETDDTSDPQIKGTVDQNDGHRSERSVSELDDGPVMRNYIENVGDSPGVTTRDRDALLGSSIGALTEDDDTTCIPGEGTIYSPLSEAGTFHDDCGGGNVVVVGGDDADADRMYDPSEGMLDPRVLSAGEAAVSRRLQRGILGDDNDHDIVCVPSEGLLDPRVLSAGEAVVSRRLQQRTLSERLLDSRVLSTEEQVIGRGGGRRTVTVEVEDVDL